MSKQERDFMQDVGGYELPDDVPEQVEGQATEYYRHPIGIYIGVVGRLKLKYRDANDKPCDPTDVGARLVRVVMPIWLLEFLGTNAAPQQKMLIQKDLTIPPEFTIPEIYYPVPISLDPKDQWKNARTFENWKLEGHNIITPHPQKQSLKITNFKSFPAYYGMSVKFSLSNYTTKANTEVIILDGGLLLQPNVPRVPADKMKAMEAIAERRLQEEIKASRELGGSDNVSQEAPDTNWDVFADN